MIFDIWYLIFGMVFELLVFLENQAHALSLISYLNYTLNRFVEYKINLFSYLFLLSITSEAVSNSYLNIQHGYMSTSEQFLFQT